MWVHHGAEEESEEGGVKIVDECTGACCEAFEISGDWKLYARILWADKQVNGVHTLRRMLIPLDQYRDGRPLFACSRFDHETRKCDRYDERPGMCRDYPYESECKHCKSAGERRREA